jgi:hypothetical protein
LGTFDQGDLLASAMGCLLAACLGLLAWKGEQRERVSMAKNVAISSGD